MKKSERKINFEKPKNKKVIIKNYEEYPKSIWTILWYFVKGWNGTQWLIVR